jgi:hypothetical protein
MVDIPTKRENFEIHAEIGLKGFENNHLYDIIPDR